MDSAASSSNTAQEPADEPTTPPAPVEAEEVALPAVSPRREWLRKWALPLLALLVAIVITMRTHGFFMVPYAVPVSIDEGYLGATALRMAYGRWLPYVDAVSQRGPILYWLTTAVMFVFGLWSWMPMRILGLALALSEISLTFALGTVAVSPLAGGFAALLACYFLNYELNPWDGVGVNGEPLAVCFVLGATLCVFRSKDSVGRRKNLLLFFSGVLSAGAGLSKQMFLAHSIPLFLWTLLDGWTSKEEEPLQRWRSSLLFVLGGVVPYALVLLIYASQRQLGTFFYYYQRYGREIFMAPVDRRTMLEKVREEIDKYFVYFAMFSMLWSGIVARYVRDLGNTQGSWPSRFRNNPWPWLLAFHCVVGLAGASFTFRFFPHYFLQLVPFISLLGGMALLGATKGDETNSWKSKLIAEMVPLAVGIMILGISQSALRRNVLLRRETDRWYQDPARDPIVRYITERTTPRQPIFVWGFRSETYLSAQRFPGSRYVYTVYPAGVVPWFQATHEEEERRVVPGSRAQLIEDLETWAPELVIDAGRSMNGRYMYNYPELRSYLDRRYCFMRYVDGEPVYRRRQGDRCPPADY